MSSTKNPIHRLFGVDAAEHGRPDPITPDPSINLQVINLGLSRTGTTSMGAALEILGFGPCHQGIDLFRCPPLRESWTSILHDLNTIQSQSQSQAETHKTKQIQIQEQNQSQDPTNPHQISPRIRYLLRGYRSSCDIPVNRIPTEIYATYPSAKYILTTRSNGSSEWWSSFDSALGVHYRTNHWTHFLFMFLIYPVGFMRRMSAQAEENRVMWLRRFGSVDAGVYDKHNCMVRELIPEGQLLVFNVKEGWEPLCRFLEVDVPKDVEFPRLNDMESMKAIYFGMQCLGACVWGLYLGAVVGGVYLVRRPEVLKGVVGGAFSWASNVVSNLRSSWIS